MNKEEETRDMLQNIRRVNVLNRVAYGNGARRTGYCMEIQKRKDSI